jgi:hypothetical protein
LLRRFDKSYRIFAMGRFNISSREGHLIAFKSLSYLKLALKGK